MSYIRFRYVLLIAILAAPSMAQDEAAYKKIIDDKSPAIVTIKCVLKVKSGRNDQEMESESSGVMIDAKGLVLCSNSRLGGPYGLMRKMMGAGMAGVSITPTDIKVIVGDAAEGLDAKFMARDSELDLAWIQIKDPGDKTFPFVDLKSSSAPKLGERLLSVFRTSKNFDRVPVVGDNVISSAIKKPREMYLAGDLSGSLGLPAFDSDGKIAGVSVLQIPEGDDEGGSQRMILGRLANSHEYAGALLPVSEVVKATARAKESAASQSAEDAAEDSTSKPAEGEKKSDDAKKDK